MIKKILTYASGEVLVKGVSFLSIPLYSHLIFPQEYGTLGFINSITSFLPFIFTFYYLYAYVRLSIEIEHKKLISTYFYLGIFLNIFYLLASLLIYFLFIKDYDIDLKYFILSVSTSAVVFMFQILQMYYRSKGFAKKYIKLSILYSLLGISLNFAFLLYFKDNVFAMLLSGTMTAVFVSLIAFRIVRQYVSWSEFDMKVVVKVLKYSVPLVPGAISLLLFSQSDKIILMSYISKESLGVYTLAFTLALSMSYIGNAFFMSYQPIFYDKLSKDLKSEIIEQFGKNIVFLIIAVLLSYAVIYIAYQFVDIRYLGGLKLAFMIALAYSFMVFSQMMELHLTYMKKTSLISFVYGVGGILTLFSLLMLIPVYAEMGAVGSLFLSGFITSVLMYAFAQKNLSLDYAKAPILMFYSFALVLGGFILWA